MNAVLFLLALIGFVMMSLLILVMHFGVSVNPVFILQSAGVGLLVSFALLVLALNRLCK